ncbi:hypothetical protein C440_08222 [Haloferax mucosum ATCC BAA-1512]|uniref:Small CPxCG-related zinc finger protein n=1 Tax=Haloferax mucosum ATCC BAA-1512 TaxID=662479 RepID=M0IG78_9EURY|nr:hypothetical protein [Haloferax mucosum]ELZ95047.1 hypothetical protein C440_08222 [Haloferax mucosum ATCC BAA-1512]
MPAVQCRECGRDIGVHEIETTTQTTPDGFDTRYRCPYCKQEMRDVKTRIV